MDGFAPGAKTDSLEPGARTDCLSLGYGTKSLAPGDGTDVFAPGDRTDSLEPGDGLDGLPKFNSIRSLFNGESTFVFSATLFKCIFCLIGFVKCLFTFGPGYFGTFGLGGWFNWLGWNGRKVSNLFLDLCPKRTSGEDLFGYFEYLLSKYSCKL